MSWKVVITREGKEPVIRQVNLPSQAMDIIHKAVKHFTQINEDADVQMLDQNDRPIYSSTISKINEEVAQL